jgi:hypothetical protein
MSDIDIWKSYFGSKVEWDSAKEDFIDHGWEARKEYMEILTSGTSDISEEFGDSFTDMLTNVYRRNDVLTQAYLSEMESEYGDLAEFIGKAFQDNMFTDMTDLFSLDNAKAFKENNSALSEGNQKLRNIVDTIADVDARQQEVNAGSTKLVSTWVTLGGKISDVTTMLGEFASTIQDAMKNALMQTDFIDRFNVVGSSIGEIMQNSITEKLLDNKFSSSFIKLNQMVNDAMSKESYSMSDISRISQEISRYTAQTELEAMRLNSALSMMNLTDEINYIGQDKQVQYEVGNTNSNYYTYNYATEISVGNMLGDSVAFDQFVDKIDTALRVRSIGRN